MSIMNFTYTKADGKPSARTFIPIHSPFTDYFGIDISELDVEEQGIFAAKAALIEDAKMLELKNLMDEFDVKNNFRRFKPAQMSDIVIEETD